MSIFVYICVVLVILSGLISLARAAYVSVKLRKRPDDGIPPAKKRVCVK